MSIKTSYLYGARAGTYWALLRRHGRGLRPTAIPFAAALGLITLANTALAWREPTVDLRAVRVRRPVFVLGHWRSGTTHLQYLLASDPRFASPSTYEVCFPNSLTRARRAHGRLLARLLPTRRLQDRMAFGSDVPNEDEIALAALGLPSPYHFWAFPAAEATHLRHLSFARATPEERARFAAGLDEYLRRLTVRHEGRTLLLKSPAHTARVALLRELYPDARFVHIHRHPYDVFRSTRHLHRTWLAHTAFFQAPDASDLDARILSTYAEVYGAFFEAWPSVPEAQRHELAFRELERDPLGELERLYAALSLGEPPRDRFRRYLEGQRGYRKNGYADLADAEKSAVFEAWGRCFEAWGYAP
jgi:omega-hydroxy-beta-dihydromenaquinone-9 sulfotransferase